MIALLCLLVSCGRVDPDEPDQVTLAPSEPVEETPRCESDEDVGTLVPIEPEPGIEPCNGTTPFCQRFTCYRCEEVRPAFFDWVARPSCDSV